MHTLCSSLLRDRSSRAITTPTLRPRTFRSVHKFSRDSTVEGSFNSRLSPNPSNLCSRSMVTWSWQTIFQLKLNFSSPTRASQRIYWHLGKISFLSLTLLLLCLGIRMLDIHVFHYHKTHIKTTQIMSLGKCLHVAHRLYR